MTRDQVSETQGATAPLTRSLIGQWLDDIDARPSTRHTYSRNIQFLFAWLEAEGISNPSSDDLKSWRACLEPAHKPTTIKNYLKVAQLFFKWTAGVGVYPDIAKNLKLPQLDREFRRDDLTELQAKKLLDKIDRRTLAGKRDYAMLWLMLTTGLRTISVASANIGDIKPRGDDLVLFYLNKGSLEKNHFVKISDVVRTAIDAYLKARGSTSADEPLFASISTHNMGQRLTTRSLSRLIKSHLRSIGLNNPRLTAHSLRHTAATVNTRAGGTVEETQQLLAHTSQATTERYIHADLRNRNRSEERIAKAIINARVKP